MVAVRVLPYSAPVRSVIDSLADQIRNTLDYIASGNDAPDSEERRSLYRQLTAFAFALVLIADAHGHPVDSRCWGALKRHFWEVSIWGEVPARHFVTPIRH